MKTRICFLLFMGMISAEKIVGQTNNASIEVASIEKGEGEIYIALFKPESKFPQAGHQFAGKIIPVSSRKSVIAEFNLPAGEYAVALFQDLNGNKKLDTNFFGIPKEPYAFSNNIKPKFSAPKFEDCKFRIATTKVNLRVDLIN